MNIELSRRFVSLGLAGLLAGCVADGGPGNIASASLGEANRQTMLAHIIDPDPQYPSAADSDGHHAARSIERYRNESKRLVGVLDRRLGESEFVGGEYSIADMAIYPWVGGMATRAPDLVQDAPKVQAWMATLAARPAVQRGMDLMKEHRRTQPFTDEERKNLFERKT